MYVWVFVVSLSSIDRLLVAVAVYDCSVMYKLRRQVSVTHSCHIQWNVIITYIWQNKYYFWLLFVRNLLQYCCAGLHETQHMEPVLLVYTSWNTNVKCFAPHCSFMLDIFLHWFFSDLFIWSHGMMHTVPAPQPHLLTPVFSQCTLAATYIFQLSQSLTCKVLIHAQEYLSVWAEKWPNINVLLHMCCWCWQARWHMRLRFQPINTSRQSWEQWRV